MVLGWFSKGKVTTEKGKGDPQGCDNYWAEEIVRLRSLSIDKLPSALIVI